MDLKVSIYIAAQLAGLSTDFIGWRLDSSESEKGAYSVADLAQAVDYSPPVPEAAWLTQAQVLAAWQSIALSAVDVGGLVASDVLVTGQLLVSVMTATVSPASGSYAWALWVDGSKVDSSATSGMLDATDGYALAINCGASGAYVLRVVAGNGDTAQLVWEVA